MSGNRVPIKDFPNYEIDEDGNVFSKARGSWVQKKTIMKEGYPFVSLWSCNKSRQAFVHHLMLETFVGPRPDGCEALHGDGDRTNYSLSNLRWGTRTENMADAVRHGTALVGSKNSRAKLTSDDVKLIKKMSGDGLFQREIAESFGVAQMTISRVVRGETYRMEDSF